LDDDSDGHGTAVASILGGASDNDKCASGIAPEVKISSCNVFADIPLTILSEKVQTFDISQNSWGIPACGTGLSEGKRRLQQNIGSCPFKSRPEGLLYEHPCDVCDFTAEVTSPQCEVAVLTHCNTNKQFENDEISCLDFLDLIIGDDCNFNKLPQSALDSISEGVQKGRDGKGIVYVFASGNEYATGDDVNFGGLTNSRLTITVGGVGKDGLHASYSTPGAALFVSAPGGDMEAISNHMAASPNDGCTSTLPGTSFSSPVVSGVIALMLEANPLLTWRDVQGILASTSQFVADPKDITATLNGAGVWHSNLYGFGIIDANAAVSAAENWTLYDPETFMVGESGSINVTISDDPLVPAQSSINITGDTEDDDLIAESVAVFLQLEHFSRGDLEILLTSPSGTVSVLTPGRRIENTQLEVDTRWKLLTVRNWGESAIGQWSLSIRDLNKGDVAECANAPFSTVFKGQSITCLTVESQEWCVGGERNSQSETNVNDLFTRQQNGITISEACCVCGGGLSSSDVKDRLMQWKLIVYGQYRGDNPPQQNVNSTAAPSATTALTFTPSAANASLAPVPAPVPSMTSNSTNSISTTSSKPSTTEMAIIITGTIFVFLAVVIAVRWACKPPVSASKFKSLNKTAEIT
jgi:kexin